MGPRLRSIACAPAAACIAVVWLSCHRSPEAQSPRAASPFRDAAAETGLRFQHFNGATGKYYLPEIMGPGVALIDYDGDGDLDVYFVQGARLEPGRTAEALFPPPREHFPGNVLYRNELIPTGQLRFVDVSSAAGVQHEGYGMGVAVGDVDNDGRPDLYVTNFGSNRLYRNNGGTFTDITRSANADDARWSASAAFFDYDRDGDLDLFVTNYVDFTLQGNVPCYQATGAPDYCNPKVYRPVPGRLLRNDGGRFTDVTSAAGINAAFGNGLGVTCADFDGDGWPDVFVANDGNENQLWMNQRNGAFRDMALLAGVAYNADGKTQAGMGVTAADFDFDGDEDVFLTHLTGETHTLYANDGKAGFTDVTLQFGLASTRFSATGFGAAWFDYDSDGFLDLFSANGGVTAVNGLRGSRYPYQQRNQLFHNESNRRFRDVTDEAGPLFQEARIGRGAAFGDIDNDGDIDIVVANNSGPAQLLLNQLDAPGRALVVRLEASDGKKSVLGARVGLLRRGKPTIWRRAHTDGSYLSANDSRVHFGLGTDFASIEGIVVYWPTLAGAPPRSEIFRSIGRSRPVTLREGDGATWNDSGR